MFRFGRSKEAPKRTNCWSLEPGGLWCPGFLVLKPGIPVRYGRVAFKPPINGHGIGVLDLDPGIRNLRLYQAGLRTLVRKWFLDPDALRRDLVLIRVDRPNRPGRRVEVTSSNCQRIWGSTVRSFRLNLMYDRLLVAAEPGSHLTITEWLGKGVHEEIENVYRVTVDDERKVAMQLIG